MEPELVPASSLRDRLVPLSRPLLPQRDRPVARAELLAAATILRTMYTDSSKMLERIARALPLAEHEVRWGTPEAFGPPTGVGDLKKGFPQPPTRDDTYTVLDDDGYGVVVAGYPQASTFCSCPDFWNSVHNPTGTCKHQIAAALWVSAQAMAELLPAVAIGAETLLPDGLVLVDPLVLLVLLLLAPASQDQTLTVAWSGAQFGVGSRKRQRGIATTNGQGSGSVVVPETQGVVLQHALAQDWLATDECLLSFESEQLSCIAETFTWESTPAMTRH